MSYFSLPLSSARSVAGPRHLVIGNWLQAITIFQASYQQLNQYVPNEPNGLPSSRFVGQCSTSQVSQLIAKMGDELATILAEMDTPLSLSSLNNHTARLTLLTNQASVILGLLTHSSC